MSQSGTEPETAPSVHPITESFMSTSHSLSAPPMALLHVDGFAKTDGNLIPEDDIQPPSQFCERSERFFDGNPSVGTLLEPHLASGKDISKARPEGFGNTSTSVDDTN